MLRKIFLLFVTFYILLFTFASPQKVLASEVEEGSTSITVKFNGNGGDSDAPSMIVTYGNTYGELPEATRENFVFQGWYSFASGGIKITATTKVFKPLNHTLYARWRGEETEITLEPEGGTVNNTTAKVYFGSKYFSQLPTPTKADFIFDGWYTLATGGEKITVKNIFTEDSPKTLYAQWTAKTVKVIFIAFNGETYEMEVTYGNEYGELPEPEKENYTFEGWYKLCDYTNYKADKISADSIVNEVGQIKLFARWYISSTEETN
jgi:uncharacterized repeat protein (TIGR02543 family)